MVDRQIIIHPPNTWRKALLLLLYMRHSFTNSSQKCIQPNSFIRRQKGYHPRAFPGCQLQRANHDFGGWEISTAYFASLNEYQILNRNTPLFSFFLSLSRQSRRLSFSSHEYSNRAIKYTHKLLFLSFNKSIKKSPHWILVKTTRGGEEPPNTPQPPQIDTHSLFSTFLAVLDFLQTTELRAEPI